MIGRLINWSILLTIYQGFQKLKNEDDNGIF